MNVLLVPAHPGFPGQIPQSRKTVVCVCADQMGPATKRKTGCGRPKSARSEANIAAVIFNAEKLVGGHVKSL